MKKIRIAVLASGGGSNLQALMDHFASLGDAAQGEIVVVIANKSEAYALERAKTAGIRAEHIDHRSPETLLSVLDTNRIDMIVLAGYLKLIPAEVIDRFRDRIINIHPGPIPQFGGAGMYGIRVHKAVLESKAIRTAVTIHFVDERYDHGSVICSWPVEVEPTDSPEDLAARVLKVEHAVYPRVVDALCAVYNSQNS